MVSSEKGRLIVIEGACDGMGKSTQLTILRNHFENDGYPIVHHHFPSYGTYHGAPVEQYLRGNYGTIEELNPYFINSLYANDRAIAWYSGLKKLYEDGKTMLFDRYTTSSIIYQTTLIDSIEDRKRFIDYVVDFEYNKLGIKEPDNVVFLHAPFEIVEKMMKARKSNDGIKNDIHESHLEYMKKVYDNAMFVADYLSWDKVQCNNGDEMRTINDIGDEVYSLVKKMK